MVRPGRLLGGGAYGQGLSDGELVVNGHSRQVLCLWALVSSNIKKTFNMFQEK